jgi:hypothetical protein
MDIVFVLFVEFVDFIFWSIGDKEIYDSDIFVIKKANS